MIIHLIAAARPNFMKIAPLYHTLKRADWAKPIIVHTGQHYDLNMSDVFFRDLGLHDPDIHLGVGSGTHAHQTAKVMAAYEDVLIDNPPDLVVVVGDVNSTMAATLAAVKLGIKVAHLEAGLRSFDRTMPEEINRIVTDSIADILWTPSPDGDDNLLREGVAPGRIHRVGNIMIDSLEMLRNRIEEVQAYKSYGLDKGRYALVTLHRPANVDNMERLKVLTTKLIRISKDIPVVFPVHPRTRMNLNSAKLLDDLYTAPGMTIVDPLGYIEFMNLVFNCTCAVTDSGGIQEETTYLGIPCVTIRPNTERPITVTQGTNKLSSIDEIEHDVGVILEGGSRRTEGIELWDGHTAERVRDSIYFHFMEGK
jgi:UDP-N-acetylglucosamine 2-epimerase (non-hydrolysing)